MKSYEKKQLKILWNAIKFYEKQLWILWNLMKRNNQIFMKFYEKSNFNLLHYYIFIKLIIKFWKKSNKRTGLI